MPIGLMRLFFSCFLNPEVRNLNRLTLIPLRIVRAGRAQARRQRELRRQRGSGRNIPDPRRGAWPILFGAKGAGWASALRPPWSFGPLLNSLQKTARTAKLGAGESRAA
jgi:hypothetical protein